MAEGSDILREWQAAMHSLTSAARSAAGGADLPKQLLAPMQRQLELVQEIVARERRIQGEIVGKVLEPFDAVFDLLEQSGATFRKQSEALAEASRALEETAMLMRAQAEIYERTIRLMREPTELAKAAAGVDRSRRRTRSPR